MLDIQNIPDKGRGVVSTRFIQAETLIEAAPTALFPAEERLTIDKTQIFPYYFVLPASYQQSKHVGGYLVFGFASLCNHAKDPNAKVQWVKKETGLWSHLIALKDIGSGEEVTLHYTNIDEYSFTT